MTEQLKMDFDGMDMIIQLLNKTQKQLEESERKVKDIAARLEGGAMTGQAGDSLRDGIRQRLAPSISSLRSTVAETEQFCKIEVEDMRQAITVNKKNHKQ